MSTAWFLLGRVTFGLLVVLLLLALELFIFSVFFLLVHTLVRCLALYEFFRPELFLIGFCNLC